MIKVYYIYENGNDKPKWRFETYDDEKAIIHAKHLLTVAFGDKLENYKLKALETDLSVTTFDLIVKNNGGYV